jgi:uncharacterized SAM-binding protein YcdF (DUF218 family)
MLLMGLILHRPLLRALGDYLIVSDPPASADAIFLLNGGLRVRPQRAAELYRDGYAPKVVITRAAPEVLIGHEQFRSVTDIALEVLREEGVADSSLILLPAPGGARSTEDEARALEAYLRDRPVRRLLVVTSDYHTRRTRWTLRRELDRPSLDLRMVPAREEFSGDEWWRTEEGLILNFEEYIKLAHTWLRGL